MRTSYSIFLVGLIVLLGLNACENNFSPKPRGYFRIDLPIERNYVPLGGQYPYSFDYSEKAQINGVRAEKDSFWLNIVYPDLHGKIHISYKPLEKTDLNLLVEDAHKFVFKHAVKASAIDESVIMDHERKMYGVFYDIGGDAASNTQFYVTDSLNHFLRGALYFNCPPDRDSLNPLVNYVREDILQLLASFKWEE